MPSRLVETPGVTASSITLFLFPSWTAKLHESCSPAQQRLACHQRPAPFQTSGTAWRDFGSKRSKTLGSWTYAAWLQAWQSKRRTLTSGRTRCGCRCIAWRGYQQGTPKALEFGSWNQTTPEELQKKIVQKFLWYDVSVCKRESL